MLLKIDTSNLIDKIQEYGQSFTIPSDKYEDLARKLSKYSTHDRDEIMADAALTGYSEVIKRMLQLGMKAHNKAMLVTPIGNQPSIVQQMLHLGDYGSVLESAADQNNVVIANLVLQFDTSPDESIMPWFIQLRHVHQI